MELAKAMELVKATESAVVIKDMQARTVSRAPMASMKRSKTRASCYAHNVTYRVQEAALGLAPRTVKSAKPDGL